MPTWQSILDAATAAQQPSATLGAAAQDFLGTLYTDAEWNAVRAKLADLARDNSIGGIEQRQREAMSQISNAIWRTREQLRARYSQNEIDKVSLVRELMAAEADFRSQAPQLAEQLPKVAQAAKEAAENPDTDELTKRIVRALSGTVPKLQPYWLVILLWWLIVYPSAKDIGAITLFYMVASDYLKK